MASDSKQPGRKRVPATFLARFRRDRRGNVAPMFAIFLIPLIGLLGVAGEVSGWYQINRSMQNASDAAAVAAATNGVTTNDNGSPAMPSYQREAYAVTAQYGFNNGVNNVVVTPTTVTCPSGSGTCYQVQISKTVPFYLLKALNFTSNGSTTQQQVRVTSIANAAGAAPPFCILALGGTGLTQDLTVNGGPNSQMNGCSVASNGDATCNGHPIGGIADSYATGTTNDCAGNGNNVQLSSTIADPYSSLSSNIPTNTCAPTGAASSYPQIPTKKSDPPLPSTNILSGTPSWSGTTKVLCGDVQLNGPVTVAAGTVLVIENGVLDLNGNSFTGAGSAGGAGTTVIFSGPTPAISGFTPSHFVTGSGTLSITAPTTGTWANMAIVQDSNLTTGNNYTASEVDMSAAGNAPSFIINGLIYAPNSHVTVSGDINSNVAHGCIGFVVATIRINGTGSIIDNAGCDLMTIPGVGGTRVALVQ